MHFGTRVSKVQDGRRQMDHNSASAGALIFDIGRSHTPYQTCGVNAQRYFNGGRAVVDPAGARD